MYNALELRRHECDMTQNSRYNFIMYPQPNRGRSNSVISLVNCPYYELIITFESTEIVLELNGSTVFFIM